MITWGRQFEDRAKVSDDFANLRVEFRRHRHFSAIKVKKLFKKEKLQ